jgi:beta-1,4-mannosyl-glycoprotein beta-1,4-N-acetylglucosaminyltransferase
MYSYEPDALAVRLEELKDVVDVHVIVEGNLTFRGNRRKISSPTGDRIRSFVVDLPEGDEVSPWWRETLQRNASAQIARDIFGKDSLLIIADSDEIPHPLAVESAATAGGGKLTTDYREWYANWRAPDEWQLYHQPVLVKASALDLGHTGQSIRENSGQRAVVGPSGWHLSTLGSAELAAEKLASFSHSEYDTPEWTEHQLLLDRIEARMDILNRFGLTETFDLPTCISKFPELVHTSTVK